MLTCPVCGRSDSSRPVAQVWEDGRTFVIRNGDAREWTEEVLTPLAARVAPPAAPGRRWLLVAAGGCVVVAVARESPDVLAWLVAAPVLLVVFAVQRVRQDVKSERVQGLWRQTWYCHGCDYVWLPGSRQRPVPSHAMRRMIRRAA